MAIRTPWAYQKKDRLLWKIPAGIKLLSVLVLTFVLFFLSIPGIVFCGLCVLLIAIVNQIAPLQIFSGSKALIVTSVFFGLIRSLSWHATVGPVFFSLGDFFLALDVQGLHESVLFIIRIWLAFALGSLLFISTGFSELREFLWHAQKIVQKPVISLLRALKLKKCIVFLQSIDIALLLSLMLAFIPRVFEIWYAAKDARIARASKFGMRALFNSLAMIIERLMSHAAETALAMEARGYLLLNDNREKE